VDTSGISADTTAAPSKPAVSPTETGVDSLVPTLTEQTPERMPLPEASADRPFTSYLVSSYDGGVVVDERRMETVAALLATEQAQRAIPKGDTLLWSHEPLPMQDGGEGRVLYMVEKVPTLDGSSLVDATTNPDPDDPSRLNVGFRLNRQGAIVFGRFTGENIGRRIAIVLDQKVRSAPVVQTKIPGGEGRITGLDSDEEAADLAIVLRAGALPAPVSIAEERTVGPSLGRDSVEAGATAAALGFVLTLIFMIVYYRWSGALACAAMILNLVIEMAILAKLRATLTLPGVAGLILTIGMSVDANVLIFERIREELAKGKTVRAGIEAGYDRAFNAILDSNVTTLITAFVLWQFGTGPVKGFATTLSIGIIVSMFTALVCTRVVYDLITTRRHVNALSV
jgi:preprotein translocase subunit SecD